MSTVFGVVYITLRIAKCRKKIDLQHTAQESENDERRVLTLVMYTL
jgi:hypothetical protein